MKRLRTTASSAATFAVLLAMMGHAGGASAADPPARSPAPRQEQIAPDGAKLVMLGTGGGPLVRKSRSQPASLLQVDGRIYLIDAGDGVSQKLVDSGYAPIDISKVFLTHLHFDHVGGLAALIGFNWVSNGGTPIDIYGPPGSKAYVDDALKYLSIPEGVIAAQTPGLKPMASLVIGHELDASAPTTIYQDDKVRVTAVENSHYSTVDPSKRVPGATRSYSYRFDTPYRSFVFSGDTGPSEALEKLARNADVLICEVMDLEKVMAFVMALPGPESSKAAPIEHMRREHVTPEEVGKLARRANVKMIVLNHVNIDGPNGRFSADLAQQVRKFFPGVVVLAQDGDEL